MKLPNLSEKIILNSLDRAWKKSFEESGSTPESVLDALIILEECNAYKFPFRLDRVVLHSERIAVLGDMARLSERSDLMQALYHYTGLIMLVQDRNIPGLGGLFFVKIIDEVDEWNTWLSVMGPHMNIHINSRPSFQQTVMAAPLHAFQRK